MFLFLACIFRVSDLDVGQGAGHGRPIPIHSLSYEEFLRSPHIPQPGILGTL